MEEVYIDYPIGDLGVSVAAPTRYAFSPYKRPCAVTPCTPTDCCPGDMPFGYYFRDGEVLSLQFNYPDNFNIDPAEPDYGWGDWIIADIIGSDGEVVYEDITTEHPELLEGWGVGTFQGQNIQVLNLLTEALPDCFRLQIRLCEAVKAEYITVYSVGDEFPALNNGAAGTYAIVDDILYLLTTTGWVGVDPQPSEGTYVWSVTQSAWYVLMEGGWRETDFDPITFGECGETLTCQTETYQRDTCNRSVIFNGTLTRESGLDCYGRYYGAMPEGSLTEGGSFAYNQFRVGGSFEQTCENPITEVSDGGAVLSTEIEQSWRLRTDGLPKSVAQRISQIILLNNYTIDGETMDVPGEICKNNDNGNLWYPDSVFTRKTCKSNPCE